MKLRQKQKIEKLRKELQATEELQIPRDEVKFFQEVLNLTPYPYQADYLRDPNPLKVLRWCRRAGKTTISAA